MLVLKGYGKNRGVFLPVTSVVILINSLGQLKLVPGMISITQLGHLNFSIYIIYNIALLFT